MLVASTVYRWLICSTFCNWGCLVMSVINTDYDHVGGYHKSSFLLPLLALTQHPKTGCRRSSTVQGILDRTRIHRWQSHLVLQFPSPCFSLRFIAEDQDGLCSQQPTGHHEFCAIHESLEHCSFMKTYDILPVPIIPQYLEQMHLTSSSLG